MAKQSFQEGQVAKTLEKQTAKIPSDIYLWAAMGAMALSLGLFVSKKTKASMFVGQWAPSILIIGLYNKLVKVEGHDQEDKGPKDKGKTRQQESVFAHENS